MGSAFRKFLSASSAVFLAATISSSAMAAAGDAFNPYSDLAVNPDTQILASITEGNAALQSEVARWVPLAEQNERHEGLYKCADLADPKCDFNAENQEFNAHMLLQDCAVAKSEFCIESLSLAPAGGSFEPANFVRLTNQPEWPNSAKLNLPGGSGLDIYSSSNAPTRGGLSTYSVAVNLAMDWDQTLKQFYPRSMDVIVSPIRLEANPLIKGKYGHGTAEEKACAWAEPGNCGILQDWAEGTRAKLTIKAPAKITGWFTGRITDPQISVEKLNSTVNRVSVTASPVEVPQLATVQPASEKDAAMAEIGYLGWGGWGTIPQVGSSAGGRSIAAFIDRYKKVTHDSATANVSMWAFSSIEGGQGSRCLSDKTNVQGIVSTNAMGYDVMAPSFQDGVLVYHVSGMHYLPDGKTPAEGTYDLIMRSDTARCLYGFSNAPISATISVVSAAGEIKTAVTTVTETQDGWLKLSARGFTFSNPIIKVAISQNSGKGPAPVQTITCVKGKLTKKVSGTAPKCPAGYKKK